MSDEITLKPKFNRDAVVLAATIRNARMGVAQSQAFLGHWTPQMYEERCKKYEADFRQVLKENFGNA